MIVKNITGLGASIGIAIGNSYIYENEVDFDIEVKFSYKEANENLIENFKKQSEEFQSLARQDEADAGSFGRRRSHRRVRWRNGESDHDMQR